MLCCSRRHFCECASSSHRAEAKANGGRGGSPSAQADALRVRGVALEAEAERARERCHELELELARHRKQCAACTARRPLLCTLKVSETRRYLQHHFSEVAYAAPSGLVRAPPGWRAYAAELHVAC